MFRRILVPLDGSARAERALPMAARLAQASGGLLFLVRVVPLLMCILSYARLNYPHNRRKTALGCDDCRKAEPYQPG